MNLFNFRNPKDKGNPLGPTHLVLACPRTRTRTTRIVHQRWPAPHRTAQRYMRRVGRACALHGGSALAERLRAARVGAGGVSFFHFLHLFVGAATAGPRRKVREHRGKDKGVCAGQYGGADAVRTRRALSSNFEAGVGGGGWRWWGQPNLNDPLSYQSHWPSHGQQQTPRPQAALLSAAPGRRAAAGEEKGRGGGGVSTARRPSAAASRRYSRSRPSAACPACRPP